MTGTKLTALTNEQHAGAGRRIQCTADRGPDRAAQVLIDGTQRDRLRSVLRRDEFGLQRLPRRRRQRLPDADGEDQHEQNERRQEPGEREPGQQAGSEQHERLRGDQQQTSVDQIADRPAGTASRTTGRPAAVWINATSVADTVSVSINS